LEPPMSEQLGVERRDDDSRAVLLLLLRDALEQVGEVRRVTLHTVERRVRLIRTLRAQVDVAAAHAPQLQTARPADLVEFEVPLVARVALVAAPDLHRGAGIAYQRGDRAARGSTRSLGDAICVVRRPRRLRAAAGFRGVVVPLCVESLRPERNVAVHAERTAGTGEMRVGEKVTEPGVGEMLRDAAASSLAGAIGALGQPAPLRRHSEQTTVLLLADGQLQPDALVAGEEREVAVRGRGSDDLEAAPLLEAPKSGNQVLVDLPEQGLQPREPRPPEVHQR